jgi:hypothetical protein
LKEKKGEERRRRRRRMTWELEKDARGSLFGRGELVMAGGSVRKTRPSCGGLRLDVFCMG